MKRSLARSLAVLVCALFAAGAVVLVHGTRVAATADHSRSRAIRIALTGDELTEAVRAAQLDDWATWRGSIVCTPLIAFSRPDPDPDGIEFSRRRRREEFTDQSADRVCDGARSLRSAEVGRYALEATALVGLGGLLLAGALGLIVVDQRSRIRTFDDRSRSEWDGFVARASAQPGAGSA